MDNPKFTFKQEQEIFLFSRMSTSALKPPSLLLIVPRFSPGRATTGHEVYQSPTSSDKAKNKWICTSPPLCLHDVNMNNFTSTHNGYPYNCIYLYIKCVYVCVRAHICSVKSVAV
jgi:hypothetical protein